MTLSFELILSPACRSSPDNWTLLGAPMSLGLLSVNPTMLEEQNSAAKWFTIDSPQGEDRGKITLHIHKRQAE